MFQRATIGTIFRIPILKISFETIISSIPPEFRLYYEDDLHLSNAGLSKLCSIIMSYLNRVLAPSNFIRRKPSRQNHSRT